MTTGVSSTKMRAGTPSSTGKKKDLGHQPSSRASEGRDHASLFSYSERGDSLCASVYDDTTSREDSISREDTTSSESDDQKRKPRRRGRPPGAKNLPKDLPKDSPKGPPKMRGRPWGSKNKIKPWQLREQLIDPMGRLRMEETEQLPLAPIIAAQSHRRAPIHTSDSPRTIVPLRFSGVEPNNYLSMEPSKRRRLTEANLLEFIVSAQSTEKEAQKADVSPLPTVAAGAIPPPLPPSVEEAYRKKCIELKRRMTEVEESNDGCRLRKARLQRGIRKMRLERAYLLEILAKRMKKNGGSIDGFQCIYDEESDGSSEAPPTPNEKPLRSKRSHRRPASSPPPLGHPQHRTLAPSQMHPTSAFEPPRDPFRESQYQHVPTTNGHLPMQYPPHPSNIPTNPISPNAPPLIRRPLPPPPAFDEFVMKHVLPNRDQFRYRTEEEGVQMAEEAWHDPNMERVKLAFIDEYEVRLQRHREELHEYDQMMQREALEQQRREMEVQQELPPAPPSREGGVGGFTSING